MLSKWLVLPQKTPVFAENVEGFLQEKETSFAELLRCRACWLRSMVAFRTQPQDVVRCRMLMPLRPSVRNLSRGDCHRSPIGLTYVRLVL